MFAKPNLQADHVIHCIEPEIFSICLWHACIIYMILLIYALGNQIDSKWKCQNNGIGLDDAYENRDITIDE